MKTRVPHERTFLRKNRRIAATKCFIFHPNEIINVVLAVLRHILQRLLDPTQVKREREIEALLRKGRHLRHLLGDSPHVKSIPHCGWAVNANATFAASRSFRANESFIESGFDIDLSSILRSLL